MDTIVTAALIALSFLSAAAIVLCIVILIRQNRILHLTGLDTHLDAESREQLEGLSREIRDSGNLVRTDILNEVRSSRQETASVIQRGITDLGNGIRQEQKTSSDAIGTRIGDFGDAQKTQFEQQNKRQEDLQRAVTGLLSERITALSASVTQKLDETNRLFTAYSTQAKEAQERTDRQVNEKLAEMRNSNAEQLEKMRAVVEQKLESTLNERISKSFELVSTRLEEVYKGLGEMKNLAGDVGNLRKVMSGVKTRGILGEVQLGAIIDEILAPGQYEKNIATKPGSREVVEFAVRLPGGTEGECCYLPIDAKFPADTYQKLLDAYDTADKDTVEEAKKALAVRIRGEAKDIRDKYIDPPHTTKFGVLFVPFEGLYAELVRMGMNETLQQQYNISLAGPTTLAALLNSLQMGFHTLAIQKRSGEIEQVLGAVKTEFGKFEGALSDVQKKMESTSQELETLVGVRTRQITRKLKTVTELPEEEAGRLLPADDD